MRLEDDELRVVPGEALVWLISQRGGLPSARQKSLNGCYISDTALKTNSRYVGPVRVTRVRPCSISQLSSISLRCPP